MLALWDPGQFSNVVDYTTWEPELCEAEDIERHIRAGSLVPINIQYDGCWGVVIRVGSASEPAQLTARETTYRLISSHPYLFRSTGRLCLSGIEAVSGEPWPNTLEVELPERHYQVVIHLIAWEDEPGSTNKDGTASETALPDFVALINPSTANRDDFRSAIVTFDRPDT